MENSLHFPYALEVSPDENVRCTCMFMTSKADAEQDSIPKVHNIGISEGDGCESWKREDSGACLLQRN